MFELTSRETEVLTWLLEGKTNWEISQILCISKSTVKAHLKHSYQKLGVSNRYSAVRTLSIQNWATQDMEKK